MQTKKKGVADQDRLIEGSRSGGWGGGGMPVEIGSGYVVPPRPKMQYVVSPT